MTEIQKRGKKKESPINQKNKHHLKKKATNLINKVCFSLQDATTKPKF